MTRIITLPFAGAMLAYATLPAMAQSPQSFTLNPGQALRVTPDGQVSVVQMDMSSGMQNAMAKRAHGMTKGLVVFRGQDGTAHYLTDPVNTSWSGSAK